MPIAHTSPSRSRWTACSTGAHTVDRLKPEPALLHMTPRSREWKSVTKSNSRTAPIITRRTDTPSHTEPCLLLATQRATHGMDHGEKALAAMPHGQRLQGHSSTARACVDEWTCAVGSGAELPVVGAQFLRICGWRRTSVIQEEYSFSHHSATMRPVVVMDRESTSVLSVR